VSQKTVHKKPRKSHRFRFHLLHQWLLANFQPCKAADVGGGKGLLAYLLEQNGWNTTVIDPFVQTLPRTFKDLTGERTTLTEAKRKSISRLEQPFEEEMAENFDLLIGLHAHGSNLKIINACKNYNKNFVLLPCCVVHEPLTIQPNINWLDSLVDYAQQLGFDVKKAELDFKGQNTIIYTNKYLRRL
jgi:hypothetical protein